ncbi:unnamed protein product [Leuciscus chuanchicus]
MRGQQSDGINMWRSSSRRGKNKGELRVIGTAGYKPILNSACLTNKLKTFSDMCKKREVRSSRRAVILKADRCLFGRIIVMAQVRSLNMEDILSHPLGPLPWALSAPDGLLRKTNKATMATAFQKNVALQEKHPENSATVVDGMNLVQRVKGDEVTFRDVATTILGMALREGSQSRRIDVVFDTYKQNSIKNSERSLRGEETGHELQDITSTQMVRQWRNFLTKVNSKTSLISFIVNEWRKPEYREKLQEKILYATVIDKCYRITYQDSEEKKQMDDYFSMPPREGYQSIVICSEDTDVFIMSLAFCDKIEAPLFLKCGTRTRTRLVAIRKVAATVGMDTCRALIGLHAYTGCDTVSAFAGKGKTRALTLLMNNKETQDTLLKLGQEWDLSPELSNKLEAFTCVLYAPKASTTMINKLRYHLFCAKKGEIESHQLPPCKNSLRQHTLGWKMETEEEGEQLVLHWMEGQPAPEAVLDLLA